MGLSTDVAVVFDGTVGDGTPGPVAQELLEASGRYLTPEVVH